MFRARCAIPGFRVARGHRTRVPGSRSVCLLTPPHTAAHPLQIVVSASLCVYICVFHMHTILFLFISLWLCMCMFVCLCLFGLLVHLSLHSHLILTVWLFSSISSQLFLSLPQNPVPPFACPIGAQFSFFFFDAFLFVFLSVVFPYVSSTLSLLSARVSCCLPHIHLSSLSVCLSFIRLPFPHSRPLNYQPLPFLLSISPPPPSRSLPVRLSYNCSLLIVCLFVFLTTSHGNNCL